MHLELEGSDTQARENPYKAIEVLYFTIIALRASIKEKETVVRELSKDPRTTPSRIQDSR